MCHPRLSPGSRPPTGSAARSVGDVPAAAPTNFHLQAGSTPVADILRSVERGLWVTSLSGFGVNPVTGDYSRGASGLWIERGEVVHPVEEVTIAGNLLDMLRDVEMVGDDLAPRSSIAAPTAPNVHVSAPVVEQVVPVGAMLAT